MAMPDRASRIPPGTRLNEIYEIERIVAAGGMGEVYRGHTIHTGDPVAIKLLRPEFGENDAALALFRKEASALHTLQHDAIVRYYVCSVDPALRRPYLAMEFVEGEPLSQLLRQGALPFAAVRTLAQRIATGLHAAHQHGIIHRDVAPDNIIVPGGDVAQAKIIDFGIARSMRPGDGTVIGDGFAGKYNYVSPEQLGLFGGDVTAKSDIYNLGLVLAEASNGRPIDMGGSQAQVVEKRRKLPDLEAVDARLRPLLEKMLQPDPAIRLDSMVAVAEWALSTTASRSERPAPAAERRPAVSDRRASGPKRIGLAAAAVVLFAAAAAGAYYFYALSPQRVATEGPSAPPLVANNAAAPPSSGTAASPPLVPQLPSTTSPPPSDAPSLTPPTTATPADTAAAPVPAPSVPPPTPAPPPASPDGGSGKVASAPPLHGPEPLSPQSEAPSLMPAPAGNLGRVEQITRFINSYDGGDCFFVLPVAVGERAASIEGYGSSLGPFQMFDSAFRESNGFEADIGLHQVTPPQCPAVAFLNQYRGQRALAPRLEIGETKLRSGETLSGTIDGYGNRHLELLLVSDDGSVLNISRLVKPRGDGVAFNLRLQLATTTGSQPQLLIAVASARPLAALQISQPANAAPLFSAAIAEAARTGQTLAAAARYFKLE
jgi:serine/threonine-protein kinase